MEGYAETSEEVSHAVRFWLSRISKETTKFRKLANGDQETLRALNIIVFPVKPKQTQVIRWVKPQRGKVKLNTDGCSHNNPGVSGAGGLLRDEQGNVIFAYSVNLGNGSSTAAEVKAILHGLKLCQERGIKEVAVESDSLMVVRAVSSGKCGVWYLEDFWDEILSLIREGKHSIQHVYREGNATADFLAKHGAQGHNRVWYDTAQMPLKLRGLLRTDKLNLPYLRIR